MLLHVSKIELVVLLQLNVFCRLYLFNDYFTVACWSHFILVRGR